MNSRQRHHKKTATKKSRMVFYFYLRHARTYPFLFYGALVAVPITTLINSFLPLLIVANVLSKLSQHNYSGHNVLHSFGPQLAIYVGLLFLGIAAWRVVDFFIWRLEMSIQQDIAEEVFNHLLQRGSDFHANNFSGSLVSQSNKLMTGYVRVADTTIFQTYPLFAGIIIAVLLLVSRSPLFVAVLVIFSIIYISVALIISKPVRKISARTAHAESQQTGALADATSNVMAIKSFAQLRHEKERYHTATSLTRRRYAEFARLHQKQMNILGFLNRTISSLSLITAVIAVMVYKANIGTVFLILSYTATIVEGLFQFSNNGLRNYNRAFGEASDMVHVLAEEPEIKDSPNPEVANITRGQIDFTDVTFTHTGAETPIFDKLNLHIQPGEKIGLIGHSGSGKSTFTRLLLRFSDIPSGEISLDTQNIANISQEDLHRSIAYVPQEPLLFHRTIKENIAYGYQGASDQAIFEAAKMASADQFIAALPQGYNTLVGERGVKLSGGQRQRIAIARAMLKNAPILLLDEATSALDSESEVFIQAALWKLMEGRTAIVIAHRLSTIQKMDRIIVLDNGKIVEEGSHKELVGKKDGTYAKLWAHQSGGFIED